MSETKQIRLPDYLQTPRPAYTGHREITEFLLSGVDVPVWLVRDLQGEGDYRPARGAIKSVIDLREHLDHADQPITFAEFRKGLAELARHFPLPDKRGIAAREKIYWRYLQGVDRDIWQAVISLAHLRLKAFPVVRDLKSLIGDVAASRDWIERRLALVEESFQRPMPGSGTAVRKALLKLRRMSPGDRLQMFNKARMRRPELRNIDMREPAKWADLVTADLGLM